MFSLSWHRTSSKPIVNFTLSLFCISFLLGVNCFSAFVSSYPFCLLSPLYNRHLHFKWWTSYLFLECEGLPNSLKRRETFRWLRMKKYRIFFLQEVYCTKEKESLRTLEWGFTAFFRSFSSASAGFCILFNNNFQFEIIRQFSDQEEGYIIIDKKIDNISSRVKKHHFSTFVIFRLLNRAHQELSLKKNSRKICFSVQTYGVQKFFLC